MFDNLIESKVIVSRDVANINWTEDSINGKCVEFIGSRLKYLSINYKNPIKVKIKCDSYLITDNLSVMILDTLIYSFLRKTSHEVKLSFQYFRTHRTNVTGNPAFAEIIEKQEYARTSVAAGYLENSIIFEFINRPGYIKKDDFLKKYKCRLFPDGGRDSIYETVIGRKKFSGKGYLRVYLNLGKESRKSSNIDESKSYAFNELRTFMNNWLYAAQHYHELTDKQFEVTKIMSSIDDILSELIGNSVDHTFGETIVEIHLSIANKVEKNCTIEGVLITISVLDDSKKCLYTELEEEVLNLENRRTGIEKVRLALENHKSYFDEIYTPEHFYMISAFQWSVSTRDANIGGGTGFPMLLFGMIDEIYDRDDEIQNYNCYTISGSSVINFNKEHMPIKPQNKFEMEHIEIGFNSSNNYVKEKPDALSISQSAFYLNGVAHNILLFLEVK